MNEAPSRSVVGEALRLLRPFWRLALFSTLVGIASGLATAFQLGAINRALQTQGGENERMQVHRRLATLNRDVEAIAAFAFGLSSLTISLAVVVASLAYLLV